MDSILKERLSVLIEDATDAGRCGTLEAHLMRGVRTIVRASDDHVAMAFEIVFTRLQEPNAQVRVLLHAA